MENYKLQNIQLGEVRLRVDNMYHSIDFYKAVFGLKVLELGKGSVKLTANGVDSLIDLVEIPRAVNPEPDSRVGLYHFALRVPTEKDLGLFIKHLIEEGIPFGQGDHLVSEAIYLSDVDNNGIEVYYDRPKEEWSYDANNEVVMATNSLQINRLLKQAGEASFIGLSPETVMGHVHLHVGNLERDGHFFTDKIGFEVATRGFAPYGALFLAADGYHHHLGINVWAGVNAPISAPPETGLDHFTILLPSDQVELYLAHLKNKEVEVEKHGDYWLIHTNLGIKIKVLPQI